MVDVGAIFNSFVTATTFRAIQNNFFQLCTAMEIDPSDSANVYKRLRQLTDWKAVKLWKLLDKRVEQAEYKRQTAAEKLKTLVIGAGPCGLKAAIECALLGSRVMLVEQRDKFSRNNVLHLWEFVIHDLKALGAKFFYPKFCTGSIEHISIRQLQCILMKVALCFGVQIHESVSFVSIRPPERQIDGTYSGYRAAVEPANHIVSEFEFDVLIGADGKRNTVPGFQKDEMRGRLAIGITANFVNNRTSEEERVPEISGVAYIFNQQFFKEMLAHTGADLENIVYYKDETHYFVMCAKKQSLLDMGVIKKDDDDVIQLLSPDNVDQAALCHYAQSAANFATNGKLPTLDFAKNHHGNNDIAMFDFTSLYSSKNSVRLVEQNNKYLLLGIVGDSLHEPFWPTGSGCARGFLGVLDTVWLIRSYGLNERGPLEMIAERESTYRLLAQVTKDNMHKSIAKYTIDPKTRYVALERTMQPDDVVGYICTDNPRNVPVGLPLVMNNSSSVHDMKSKPLQKYSLWRFCYHALVYFRSRMPKIYDLDYSWRDGKALCALVSKFRPELVDYDKALEIKDPVDRIGAIFETIKDNFDVFPPCDPVKWEKLSAPRKLLYIQEVVDYIREDVLGMRKALISTPRPPPAKGRKIAQAPAAPSEKISRLTQEMGWAEQDDVHRKVIKTQNSLDASDRHAKRLERLNTETQATHEPVREYKYKTTTEQIEDDRLHYTKRPQVDRLNPELVYKVEKIVNGELVREQTHDLYAEKDRKAQQNTQKIDRSNLEEMERKLEAAAQGLLAAKKENMSSQDEKIIRASAADARREAESGFAREAEMQRFKNIDDTIRRSNEMLKKKDLTGIDPFNRNRALQILIDPTKAPPTPPKTVTVENQENGVVIRPVAPVQPKRHVSMPVIENVYDSVNSRKQTNCQLCDKVVYLAERMQVESIFIHKNCFRCAYCAQPLRLGEYGKDKDLEYYYPKKFFCKIHLRVPLREKVNRINRVLERTASKDAEDAKVEEKKIITPVPPLPVSEPPKPDSGETFTQRTATLNFFSPEQLRDRTEKRIQSNVMRDAISPISDIGDERTPERAEFHFGKNTSASRAAAPVSRLNISTSTDSDDDEDNGLGTSGANGSDGNKDDDVSLSDDDAESVLPVEEEELRELERTVLEYDDEAPLTDAQVVSVIEQINRRRSAAMAAQMAFATPSTATPQRKISEEEQFFTPAVTFRQVPSTPLPTRERARTIAGLPTEMDEYMTPSADDIRKVKIEQLEKLRSESRQKAKLKTDEELGLGTSPPLSTSADRRSVPQISFDSSPISRRSTTEITTKPRSSSLLNYMPSMQREFTFTSKLPPVPASPDPTSKQNNDEIPATPPLPAAPPPPPSAPISVITSTPPVKNKPSPIPVKVMDVPRLASPAGSSPKPKPPMSSPGMLSKLFSPDLLRKKNSPTVSPVPPASTSTSSSGGSPTVVDKKVNCESRKETSILNNAMKRVKSKRETTPIKDTLEPRFNSELTSPAVSVMTENRDVPCAAVAPSPRVSTTESLDSPTLSGTIPVTAKNIRIYQQVSEKIRRQNKEEKRRTAQDIQRSLGECETRLEEVTKRGKDLERKLKIDSKDRCSLESWAALAQEVQFLKWREENLSLRMKAMQLESDYKLQKEQLDKLGLDYSNESVAALKALTDTTKSLQRIKKMEEGSKRDLCKVSLNASFDEQLRQKDYDFKNCQPVFT